MKIGLNPAAQDIDRPGLSKAWGPLDQQVAIGQQGHQHALDQALLPNDLCAHVVLKVLKGLLGLGQAEGRLLLFLNHEKNPSTKKKWRPRGGASRRRPVCQLIISHQVLDLSPIISRTHSLRRSRSRSSMRARIKTTEK